MNINMIMECNQYDWLIQSQDFAFSLQAVEISRPDYEPTDMDILYAEGITSSNSVASLEFSCLRLEQDSMMDTEQRNPMTR